MDFKNRQLCILSTCDLQHFQVNLVIFLSNMNFYTKLINQIITLSAKQHVDIIASFM